MRKQTLIIGSFIAIIISVTLFLPAGNSHKPASAGKTCSKTCQQKATPNPQTGFFIFDSFSGSL